MAEKQPDPTSNVSPDRSILLTEQRLARAASVDAGDTAAILRAINEQDQTIPQIVAHATPNIAKLVDAIVAGIRSGGRLVYIGAGTSGRLGVLDASECPPTFHTDPQQVIGIIAGGDGALRKSAEGAEDDFDGARIQLEPLDLGSNDVVVGITAGGTTPYVHGGLSFAKSKGCATGFVCCVPLLQLVESTGRAGALAQIDPGQIDHLIELPVGPEFVTGSTRMKAGTATKLCLNMITTAAMVRLGKTWGDLMVDLRATNAKLRDRAIRMICDQTELSRNAAQETLGLAGNRVKVALVMARLGVSADEASAALCDAGGHLDQLIGPPRTP